MYQIEMKTLNLSTPKGIHDTMDNLRQLRAEAIHLADETPAPPYLRRSLEELAVACTALIRSGVWTKIETVPNEPDVVGEG